MSNRLSLTLHLVRSHEIMDFKRCPKKWYWKWRRGLVAKAVSFGALELGTWMHTALAAWYRPGFKRNGYLAEHFAQAVARSLDSASGAPDHVIAKAEELAILGEEMANAYQMQYQDDPAIDVLATEVPLEFTFTDPNDPTVLITHKLKPDLIYYDANGSGDVWLMEHKTAAQIRTTHLAIDGQARPYGAMAERALKKAKLISSRAKLRGIMYNFLRKGLPDERPTDAQGRSLNKDGSISKKQPARAFLRHPVTLTADAKRVTLQRISGDSLMMSLMTRSIREGKIDPRDIPITPHHSCPKTCQFFEMCVAGENGADTRTMEETLYVRKDPYVYYEETTDEPVSFEMG